MPGSVLITQNGHNPVFMELREQEVLTKSGWQFPRKGMALWVGIRWVRVGKGAGVGGSWWHCRCRLLTSWGRSEQHTLAAWPPPHHIVNLFPGITFSVTAHRWACQLFTTMLSIDFSFHLEYPFLYCSAWKSTFKSPLRCQSCDVSPHPQPSIFVCSGHGLLTHRLALSLVFLPHREPLKEDSECLQ